MKPTRIAAHLANTLLGRFGLELSRRGISDFDARLESPKHLEFLFDDLAAPMQQWIDTQKLFTPASRIQVRPAIERFYREYLESPFRAQVAGSRFNNLLWLYLLANAIRPTVIVDSGTYAGASAWAMSLGSPDSPQYSFDIDLSRLKLRRPGVQYIQADWATFDMKNCDISRGLGYFDDHVDQIGRLIQATDRGIPLAIFDDDLRVTSYLPMDVNISLPKIEFALDGRLHDKETISWSFNGRMLTWQVDRAYLDRGRLVIQATERLPDTSLITGIAQTPYRLVALKKSP